MTVVPNPPPHVVDYIHATTASQSLPREPLQPATPLRPYQDVKASPCSGPLVSTDTSLLLDPSLPQPLPLPSALPQPLTTPITEDPPHVHLTLDLPPSSNLSLPPPAAPRSKHNLRLPSFHVLGIAAPYPDRILAQPHLPFSPLGAGPLSKPEDPLHALSPLPHNSALTDPALHTPLTSPKAAASHVGPSISTHTPPLDSDPATSHWGSFMNTRTPGLGSPPNSDPGVPPGPNIPARESAPPQSHIIVPTHNPPQDDVLGMAAWIEMAKTTIIHESGCLGLDSVKILSHALPCPSTTGHVFGEVISSIHDASSTHTAWINVFHALPGRYTLLDLPKSPPSTPGPAVGGDSYFTTKIFDSAVPIPDYQLDSKLLPPSPRPVVPPGSINISIVERYIPPTNTNEFAEMFTFQGRSLLYDRLIELSSDNGILLFIYPTKAGAKTFMRQYLGPILDPLLRTVTVVHELHSELGRDIGQMSSVNYLDDYDHLDVQVRRFCQAMSERCTRADNRATYQVIHAAKEEVVLERSAWADDWWIKQEKPRVRDVVMKYFNKSKKLPMGELSAASLIQHVLDGVSKREYQDVVPTKGVEVGIFIVKKTKAANAAQQSHS